MEEDRVKPAVVAGGRWTSKAYSDFAGSIRRLWPRAEINRDGGAVHIYLGDPVHTYREEGGDE